MSLKEQVLHILIEQKGQAVSGQWLANQFLPEKQHDGQHR